MMSEFGFYTFNHNGLQLFTDRILCNYKIKKKRHKHMLWQAFDVHPKMQLESAWGFRLTSWQTNTYRYNLFFAFLQMRKAKKEVSGFACPFRHIIGVDRSIQSFPPPVTWTCWIISVLGKSNRQGTLQRFGFQFPCVNDFWSSWFSCHQSTVWGCW